MCVRVNSAFCWAGDPYRFGKRVCLRSLFRGNSCVVCAWRSKQTADFEFAMAKAVRLQAWSGVWVTVCYFRGNFYETVDLTQVVTLPQGYTFFSNVLIIMCKLPPFSYPHHFTRTPSLERTLANEGPCPSFYRGAVRSKLILFNQTEHAHLV